MYTGAFDSIEKDRCKTFLEGKYKPSDILEVHMTQHEKKHKCRSYSKAYSPLTEKGLRKL